MAFSTLVTLTLLLVCLGVGAYGGHYLAFRDGYFDAIRACVFVMPDSPAECLLSIPDLAHIPHYTGYDAVDFRLAMLLEFFSQGVTSPGSGLDVPGLLAMAYLGTQFAGAWYLLAMEGLRRKNAGSLASWTGVWGCLFQIVTITVVAPIYLCQQLLGSSSLSSPRLETLDMLDLQVLPWATVIGCIIPTIGLTLPLANVVSAGAKYFFIALWQPFPMYQSIAHGVLRRCCGNGKSSQVDRRQNFPAGYKQALNSAYSFTMTLTMSVHLMVVAAVAISHYYPEFGIPPLSATAIFSPGSLVNPPTLALKDLPLPAIASRQIVVSFLRWDVYCAAASFVVWSVYTQRFGGKAAPGLFSRIFQVALWTAVGGPATAAAALLWKRDLFMISQDTRNTAGSESKKQR